MLPLPQSQAFVLAEFPLWNILYPLPFLPSYNFLLYQIHTSAPGSQNYNSLLTHLPEHQNAQSILLTFTFLVPSIGPGMIICETVGWMNGWMDEQK